MYVIIVNIWTLIGMVARVKIIAKIMNKKWWWYNPKMKSSMMNKNSLDIRTVSTSRDS